MIVYRTAVVMSTALAWSKLLWDKPWGMPVGTACERTAAAPGRPPGRRGVYGVPYLRGVGPALAGRARGRAEGGHYGAVVVAGRGGRRCVRATLSRPGPSRHTRWTLTRQTYSGAGGASPWTWGWCFDGVPVVHGDRPGPVELPEAVADGAGGHGIQEDHPAHVP